MSTVLHTSDAAFQHDVLESPLLTIVDLWAQWCMPCKRLAPILDKVAATHAAQIRITKLDVDANPITPGAYGVSSIPTLLLFRDGQLLDTVVGFLPEDRLLAKLAPYVAQTEPSAS